jgi:hypothetical protein
MTADEHRGLGLLLALSSSGCLGLPRYTDDGEGDGTTTRPAGEETTTEAIDGTTVGPVVTTANGTTSPGVPADVGVATITTASVSVGDGPDMGDGPDVTTDGPSPDACQGYSALVTECYGAEQGEAAYGYCLEYLAYIEQQYGPECVPLFEEFVVCLSALSCRELTGGGGPSCEVEQLKAQECLSDG